MPEDKDAKLAQYKREIQKLEYKRQNDATFTWIVKDIVKEANKLCSWCAKDAPKRDDGYHVSENVVVDKCTLGGLGPLIHIVKKILELR